ncbi:MAG TPA: acetate--CoA ligase [Vicinamibacterales bacterium]
MSVAGAHRFRSIPILKPTGNWTVPPNLVDYAQERQAFSWIQSRAALDGLPDGGLNMAHEAVDRHAVGAHRDRVAIRWLGRDGARRDLTYGDLRHQTNQFANALKALGVGKGDVIAAVAGRVPALYVAALGTLKNGSVFAPLFSAFGPEPIQARLAIAKARVLVTTDALYQRKIQRIRDRLPHLQHVLLIDGPEGNGTRALGPFLDTMSAQFTIPRTEPEDLALLHFTSGTTGTPKGAMHVHDAVLAHYVTAKFALDLHPDDVFWCTADPGWVTGTSYGIIAPLAHGVTMIVDESDFDADRWYRILEAERVTVWYTAPTAIRMLMKAGANLARARDLRALRFLGSVGEPLNPEAVVWSVEAFGRPFHDNWWQTETGGIMIANFASMEIRPGSMGRPLPGVDAAVVQRTNDGVTVIGEPDHEGELALRTGWPSMFRGYLGEEERYRKCFAGEWYLTGDLVRRDPDGYYWFVGRADDVIKSAGHLIGPFEVESALMEHPAIAEAGVIGKPDPIAGEIVKAFVVPRVGITPSDELRLELVGFGRTRAGRARAPRRARTRA